MPPAGFSIVDSTTQPADADHIDVRVHTTESTWAADVLLSDLRTTAVTFDYGELVAPANFDSVALHRYTCVDPWGDHQSRQLSGWFALAGVASGLIAAAFLVRIGRRTRSA